LIIYKNDRKYYEYQYPKEEEFESDVVKNAVTFFGKKTIYIDTKKKIKSKSLGNSIPDGFLLDLSDEENPEFYIVEAELNKHDFYSHIFPQLTKFFAFYKSMESRNELVSKIYTIINEDPGLRSKLREHVKKTELYKYVKDMIENSQNILLIIDGEKKELPEIINTYTDTWGKMVKVQIIKKFTANQEELFTMEPEFEAIEFSIEKSVDEVDKQDLDISEDYHLENKPEHIKQLFALFKNEVKKINSQIKLNPQKYYISVINDKNVVFIQIRKKKIRFIVMQPEAEIKNAIKLGTVKTLSQSVQKFYNGDCAAIDIENTNSIPELLKLIKPLLIPKEGEKPDC